MKNILIAIPQLEVHRPPISTAVIAGTLKKNGFDVKCLDLNIELFKQWGSDDYYHMSDIWESNRTITEEETIRLQAFIKKELLVHCDNETRLMISVFTQNSQLFSHIICEMTRDTYPQCEIVIGGQGVTTKNISESSKFGEIMLKANLVDYVIYGEGEQCIIELLNGNTSYPGINNNDKLLQIPNLDDIAFPNYDQYDLQDYDYLLNKPEVNIVGSRGCVRKCTYCDVAAFWPKFRYRTGQNISDEMISQYEKHGVNTFYFTDSLINGSLKAFRDMCDKLANYNQTHKAGFEWGGQFIFKPKKQLTDDYFDMIAEAGGNTFYVGVETGSDKIRWEMDKKFTNEDIDYHLHHFQRTGMHCFYLMIIGYLTETLEDHQDNLAMFSRWQKYVASKTITGIDLSTTLGFLPNTPLSKMIDSHKVKFLAKEYDPLGNETVNSMSWVSGLNPELTFEERIRRRLEVHEYAMKYKWPIWRGPQRLKSLYNLTKLFKEGTGQRVSLVNIN